MSRILSRSAFATSAFALACWAGRASAHIDMLGVVEGRQTENALADQKKKPCEGVARGTNVFTFEPGAVITLGVRETVGHPGYFRIAFDNDGEDGFVDPQSIDPIDPNRISAGKACDDNKTADSCGQSDFCNVKSSSGGAAVLYDNVDPHNAGLLAGKPWNWTIKLPDVECENCTLQIMQVMQDPLGHGLFDGQSDLYYRCVDIKLKRGAGMTPGTVTTPVVVNGLDCTAMANGQDAGTPVVVNDGGAPVDGDAGHPVGHIDGGSLSGPDGSAPVARSDGGADSGAVVTLSSGGDGEDDGCSVGNVGQTSTGDLAFALGSLLAGGLVLRRRRRS